MKKYGIIFDFDGTLVNSLGHALESFNYALKAIGEHSRRVEEVKKFFGAGADRIFLNVLGDERKAEMAFEHFLVHQTKIAQQTKLHDGVRELLEKLSEEKIPLAIVTGRHSKDLQIVLKP